MRLPTNEGGEILLLRRGGGGGATVELYLHRDGGSATVALADRVPRARRVACGP